MNIVNVFPNIVKIAQILCKYCANIVQILCNYMFQILYNERLKHLELMQLGRSNAFKCSDIRLEVKMMAKECLVDEDAVQAYQARQLRLNAKEEQKEAEKFWKATEVEKLRKAEVAMKEKEAEVVRLKAAAASEAWESTRSSQTSRSS